MSGKIYGGTRATGHLFVFDPNTGASTDLGQAVPGSNGVSSLTAHNGKIYGGTGDTGHLFVYDPATKRMTDLGIAVAGESSIHTLTAEADGKIWGGTGRSGHLFAYDPTTGIFYDKGIGAPGNTVYALVTAPDGTLYGGTQGGYLFAYRQTTGDFVDLGQPVPGETVIYSLVLGADGILYGGTGTSRGHFFVYNTVTGVTTDKGRASWAYPAVQALVRSPDGKVYGGTSELFVYDPADHPYHSPGTAISVDIIPGVRFLTSEPSNEVMALELGDDGRIYIGGGSSDGHLRVYDPLSGALTDLGRPVAEDHCTYSLTTGADGRIYGGTAGSGPGSGHLYVYDPATGALTDLGQLGRTDQWVPALTVGSDGKIYAGTSAVTGPSGHIFMYDPATGTISGVAEFGTDVGGVFSLTTGADGKVYIGTRYGHLFLYDPATGLLTDLGTGASGNRPIVALATATDGTIYGYGYGALFSYDPSTGVFAELESPGPPSFFVTSLSIIDAVVYGTSRLFESRPWDGRGRVVLFAHDISRGTTRIIGEPLVGAEIKAIAADNDGRIYSHTWTRDRPSFLISHDPNYAFGWSAISFSKSTPSKTAISVDVLSVGGELLLDNVSSGASLASINPTTYPGIKLRAELATSDRATTPRLLDWGVVWWTVTADPEFLSFSLTTHDPDLASSTVHIGTTSDVTVEWTAFTDQSWLSVSPTSGIAPATLTVTVDKSRLAPNTRYTGTITINWSRGSARGSIKKNVSLHIIESANADFTANPTSGLKPLLVSFTNQSTGEYDTCAWSFGDGSASSVCSNPAHTYTNTGVYTVSLTVSGLGGVSTLVRPAYITVHNPVNAGFVASPTRGPSPLLVSFTNQSTGEYDTCAWDFGDGKTSSKCDNPTHTYTSEGKYSVSLTINGPGGSDTATRTDYINVEDQFMIYLPMVIRQQSKWYGDRNLTAETLPEEKAGPGTRLSPLHIDLSVYAAVPRSPKFTSSDVLESLCRQDVLSYTGALPSE